MNALNLGCGEDKHPDAWNVDAVEACNPDELVDLSAYPWPWPDGRFVEIRAYHVLEHLEDIETALGECERLLRPGGTLTVKLPIGLDARADPDHKHEWTWRTPVFYCGERHWDTDVGLRVIERDVRLWSMSPVARPTLTRLLERAIRRYGPGHWCFALPAVSGEFTVTFEKP